ncbi:MAG: hypothetical protein D6795_21360, partial [Deltaproteobacteria bacterium]
MKILGLRGTGLLFCQGADPHGERNRRSADLPDEEMRMRAFGAVSIVIWMLAGLLFSGCGSGGRTQ